ncbi:MAG: hypothetical protein M0C28_22085 [Candidatus Moduliflexus flocculans]|nr:hypothetical protein [Candidatus Moduliflexus flocculans]
MAPHLASASHGALGLCWKVVVAGEVLAEPARALGTGMQGARVQLETAEVFAWTLAGILLCALTDAAFKLIQKKDPLPYELHDIRKSFGDLQVLSGFTLDFPSGKVTAVLGPSGCGNHSPEHPGGASPRIPGNVGDLRTPGSATSSRNPASSRPSRPWRMWNSCSGQPSAPASAGSGRSGF